MADIEQLSRALRNAANAGDERAARILASEIRRLQAQQRQAEAPVRSAFDELPWWAKAGKAADDAARIVANAATLGFADRFASKMGGTPLEDERGKSADAVTRAGSATLPLQLLGLVGPGKAASTAVAKVAPALGGSGTLATLAREGIAGTGLGAGTAAGEGEDIPTGMIEGGVGGIAGGALGKAAGAWIDALATRMGGIAPGILSSTRVPRKSLDEMVTAKDEAYKRVDDAGIVYEPNDVQDLLKTTKKRLSDADIDRELHPTATARNRRMRSRLGRRQKKPTKLQEIDTQRQLISRDVKEPEMARIMRETLDEFIKTKKPRNVSTELADELLTGAREANRKLAVRRDVEGALEKARNTRAGELNESPMRSLLNRGTEGMTEQEAKLLKNVVRGEGWEQNLANVLDDLAKRTGSIGAGATAGGLLGGMAGVPFAGAAIGGGLSMVLPPLARKGANVFKKKNLDALLDELGGGKTIPSAVRKGTERGGGGVGAGVLEEENDKRRRRSRLRRRRED